MAMVALTHAHTQSPLKKTKAWHHLSFYMPSITDPFLSLKGVKKKRTFVSLKLCILRITSLISISNLSKSLLSNG
jgi:hypothetical protein